MDIWHENHWFAIQGRPHQENLAAANVARLDVEVFLPRVKQIQSVCGVQRWLTKPLFSGYFFGKFVPVVSMDAVRYCHGVLRVVGTSRYPIPLEAEIIASIRERLEPDGLIHLESRTFKPGDAVKIEKGPFAGFMGKVERESEDGARVAILLEVLQHARLVVEKNWVTSGEAV